VVDRIAKLLGRDGVGAAARVLATGDEQARYDFARHYPDEPTARKIWNAAEAKYRERFERKMVEAKAEAEARINTECAALEASLKTATQAFETWLADERRATAKGAMPDPFDLIGAAEHREEHRLRAEIAALNVALARANAEIARASPQLTALSRSRWKLLSLAAVACLLTISGILAWQRVPGADKSAEHGWFVVLATSASKDGAEADLPSLNKRCGDYVPTPRIIDAEGLWRVVLGPHSNSDEALQEWKRVRPCALDANLAQF
jgi:hypothetical protein